MDGRGYPAYRDLQGAWDLGPAVLHVDHVQSDPYAPPSKIRLVLDRAATAVPAELVREHSQRVAAGDHLNRGFCAALQRVTPSGQATVFATGLTNVTSERREHVPGDAIHEMGGARMGADPRQSVLNK